MKWKNGMKEVRLEQGFCRQQLVHQRKVLYQGFSRNINRQSGAMSLYSAFNHSFLKGSYTANLPGLGGPERTSLVFLKKRFKYSTHYYVFLLCLSLHKLWIWLRQTKALDRKEVKGWLETKTLKYRCTTR